MKEWELTLSNAKNVAINLRFSQSSMISSSQLGMSLKM